MGRESRLDRTSGDIRDFANRPLVEGDEVVILAGNVQRYRVASITPVLDPNGPPNMRKVTLVSTVLFIAGLDSPNPEFAIVRKHEEFAQPKEQA